MASPLPSPTSSSTPSRKCTCGKVVLFPNGLTKRTCMNCSASIHLEGNHLQPPSPSSHSERPFANSNSERHQTAHAVASSVQRGSLLEVPSRHPSQLHVSSLGADNSIIVQSCEVADSSNVSSKNLRTMVGKVIEGNRRVPRGRRSKKQEPKWMPISKILVIVLVANAFYFLYQVGLSKASKKIDTDKDGIPDHLDMCPSPSECVGECPPQGWLSGRSTDFDSDGCADGLEDLDRDNDGIVDEDDVCPKTPQSFKFFSNIHTDFDSDGCADRLEDDDDDNDLVGNNIDACPFTVPGEQCDDEGCTHLQRLRKDLSISGWDKPEVSSDLPLREKPSDDEEESAFQAWKSTVFNVGLQVIMGIFLEQLLEAIYEFVYASSAESESPDSASPDQSDDNTDLADGEGSYVPEHSAKYFFRLCYGLVIVYVLHDNRCSLSATSSLIGVGFEAIGLQCPGI